MVICAVRQQGAPEVPANGVPKTVTGSFLPLSSLFLLNWAGHATAYSSGLLRPNSFSTGLSLFPSPVTTRQVQGAAAVSDGRAVLQASHRQGPLKQLIF